MYKKIKVKNLLIHTGKQIVFEKTLTYKEFCGFFSGMSKIFLQYNCLNFDRTFILCLLILLLLCVYEKDAQRLMDLKVKHTV